MTLFDRLFPHPVLSVALLLVWLMLQNSADPGNVVLGAAIGIAIPIVTRRFWPGRWRGKPVGQIVALIGIVVWDIILANLVVARIILTKRTRNMRPHFVDLPLASDNEYVITLLASIITMTPGTVSVDLDRGRAVLVVHALDLAGDPGELVDEIKHRYERRLMEIFG